MTRISVSLDVAVIREAATSLGNQALLDALAGIKSESFAAGKLCRDPAKCKKIPKGCDRYFRWLMTRYQNSTAAAETTRLHDQLVLKIFGEPCLSLIDSIACQSWLTVLSNDSRYLSTLYALSDRIKLMTREFDTLPASEQFRDVLAAFKVNGVRLLHTRRSFQTPSEFLTCAQFQDGHRLPATPPGFNVADFRTLPARSRSPTLHGQSLVSHL
ncbi:MAG TPA: hypothetical protein VEV37_08665 [Bryobacteraceae bacterium]|nr:hypothetical protein [Bryobacteraceae bacterium]